MMGTPNGGSVASNLCSTVIVGRKIGQCEEKGLGAQFLKDLNTKVDWGNSGISKRLSLSAGGRGGSAGNDGVAYDYADLVGTQVQYFDPQYGHGDYQKDPSTDLNANITYILVSRNSSGALQCTSGTSKTAEHAIRMVYKYVID